MPSFDLIVKNGKVISSGELHAVDICISEGKIAAIEKIGSGHAARIIDANGLLVLPGLIDPHVHFRDPGFTEKEDFESGTKGAAAGGTTTVFDMPNTNPVVTTPSVFRDKVDKVQPKAVVNFGLVAAASHENLEELTELAESGAIAFKTFMVSPPIEREKEYAGSFVTNSGQLYEVMKEVRKTELVHCIHAENDALIFSLTKELRSTGRKDPLVHFDSRPNFVEADAVYEALLVAEVLRSKLHLVHLSTSEGVQLLAHFKNRNVDVSAETCPQYLTFTKEILEEKGPDGKFNPPARNEADSLELLNGLKSGLIEMVSTDHAPHLKKEKQLGWEDIFKAPSGTPGVETRLPILLKMVHEGSLSMFDIPKITAEAAARRFGLYPRKGVLQVESDADLALVDYDQTWKIRASELQTKSWETVLYDGMEVSGKVKFTILKGEIAFEEGVGFGKTGKGEFLRPNY
ncbi:MAG: dihydroorotase family protein [Thaumarchaeota archaeon]|nr:dihydroorotase family protein [Nitrososphaerota archaeon]